MTRGAIAAALGDADDRAEGLSADLDSAVRMLERVVSGETTRERVACWLYLNYPRTRAAMPPATRAEAERQLRAEGTIR